MKQLKRFTALALILTILLAFTPVSGQAASNAYTPTGYTKAEDVQYKTVSGTIVNWGARNEDCTFLSTKAQDFYTGTYIWSTLSQKSGGSTQTNAHYSDLYKALQTLMKNNHKTIQGYQTTRQYYQYTDCVRNDNSQISSFYSGNMVNSTWTGTTYNREHIWPRSKCIDQSKANDSADIMMLRATITSENGDRGNSAYGLNGNNYYTPDADVRGDCARMILYGYVRWGNTSYMWGSSGVMESLTILLQWMEADPVDTWEMGRNDSVQSITGTRNVFVDYPEYAFLLFGKDVPTDMVTPSGKAAGGSVTPPVVNPPVVNPPVNTEPPVTEPPVTEPPVTEPPVTNPPVTNPPVTNPPVTEPPVTEPPATEPPVTGAPETQPSITPTDPSDPPSNEFWNDITLWIILAVVVVGGATAVIVIVVKKKRAGK